MQKAADNMQKAAERKKPKAKVDNLPQIAQPPKSQGYQNRKNVPYSELFWKKVLDNNHIPYEVNVPISKPGLNNYYLDFLIYGKIDLEIDGSLHERPDVKKKDIVRTAYLIEKGFIVYRIAWINPNTLPHKILVSQQIENLLKFLEENK